MKFRPIMDLRKYFDRCFDAELAAELADLGYEIETEFKEDAQGQRQILLLGHRGHARQPGRQAVAAVAGNRPAGGGDRRRAERTARTNMPPISCRRSRRTSSGATSRRVKRDDLTLEECREYWDSRRTDDESDASRRGDPPGEARPQSPAGEPAGGGGVVLHAASFREGIGVAGRGAGHHRPGARAWAAPGPADIERELKRQGVIIVEKDGQRLATTEALQEEEWGLAAYALDGRGTVAPIGVADGLTRTAGQRRDALPTGNGTRPRACSHRRTASTARWARPGPANRSC